MPQYKTFEVLNHFDVITNQEYSSELYSGHLQIIMMYLSINSQNSELNWSIKYLFKQTAAYRHTESNLLGCPRIVSLWFTMDCQSL